MDENFLEKNKKALIEEMAENLNNMIDTLSTVVAKTPVEDIHHDNAILRNVLIAMSQNLGSLTALFNQYYVLETGALPEREERPIGFQSLHKDNKE